MVTSTIIEKLLENSMYLPLFAGLAAFFLSSSIYLYPVIINISNIKGLMDAPDKRKMHAANTPTLGGLGVFLAFSLSIIVFALLSHFMIYDLTKLIALLGSAIVLVFLGIKDDLTGMTPKNKFIGQLLAVLTVVVLTDVRVLSFGGLLGIGELPYFVSVLFSVFVFVLVINALNLIDGIDGLAGGITILASVLFGVFFFLKGDYLMALTSSILVGSIFGFLKYNLSADKKIFMGDCGSLLTGFLLAYQGICFLNLNNDLFSTTTVKNAPIVLLAILSYPLFDLLRVFSIRIKQGRSPFSADANHIHHRLLRVGLSHKRATLFLVLANSIVFVFSYFTSNLNIHLHLMVTLLFGTTIYLIPFLSFFEKLPRDSNGQKVNSGHAAISSKGTILEFSKNKEHLETTTQLAKKKDGVNENSDEQGILQNTPKRPKMPNKKIKCAKIPLGVDHVMENH